LHRHSLHDTTYAKMQPQKNTARPKARRICAARP
jgi:hypothetical protein